MNVVNLLAGGVIAVVIAIAALDSPKDPGTVGGERRDEGMTPDREIALGRRMAPEVIRRYGGMDPDSNAQSVVERIGHRLVERSSVGNGPYKFRFHLLADTRTVNVVALPGGPVFITRALFDRLRGDAEVAAVLGHAMGHVVGRHAAHRLAGTESGSRQAGGLIASFEAGGAIRSGGAEEDVDPAFDREDEKDADGLGVRFLSEAGYDPCAMIDVMMRLGEGSKAEERPVFFRAHPDPDNRIERIKVAIRLRYPQGVPSGLDR